MRKNKKNYTERQLKKIRLERIFRFRMLVMIFIQICPVFHWMRNLKNIRNFYYYVCLAEFEQFKHKDSRVIDMLYKDLLDSKDSFDKLYAVAHFMSSPEFRALVKDARNKKMLQTKNTELSKI